MLTIGLIIGLFVAFLVYLDDLDDPPKTAVEQSRDDSGGASGEAGSPEGSDGDGGQNKPEFEFYSILPELEVVVPDRERGEGEPGSDGDGAGDADAEAEAEADAAGDAEPAPRKGETFYLQAGSFQKAEQADRMKARIALLGLDVAIQDVEINGQQWHRVRVGPYTDPKRLRAAQERLRNKDIDYLVLRQKDRSG